MDILKTAQAAVAAVSGELGALRDKKNSLSQRLIAIDAEIERLRKLPIPIEDLRIYLKHFISQVGKEYASRAGIDQWLRRRTHDQPLDERGWDEFEDADGKILSMEYRFMPEGGTLHTANIRALCFFFPDVVEEKLWNHFMERIANGWKQADVPSVAQRREQIAQLQEERDAVDGEYQQVKQSIDEIQNALNL